MSQQQSLYDKLNTLTAQNRLSESVSLLEEVNLSLCPDIDTYINVLAIANHSDNFDFCRQVINIVPNMYKNNIAVLIKCVELCIKLDDPVNVARFSSMARSLVPQNAWTYYLCGKFLFNKLYHKQALCVLAEGIENASVAASGENIIEGLQETYSAYYCYARRDDIRFRAFISERKFYTGRGVYNALFVSMVKDEGDIIFECLDCAYKTGFRNFMIANNGSTDHTESEIARFDDKYVDATVVIIKDPIIGFWQDKKINAFWRFAVDYFAIQGHIIEWIFPIDGDELIVQADENNDLYGFLNSRKAEGKTLLAGLWCTATPDSVYEEWAIPGNINRSFPIISGYGGNGHNCQTFMKVAFRASSNATLRNGNHFAAGCVRDTSNVGSLNEQGIFLLHHPIRSKRQFRSKIVNGVKGLEAAPTVGSDVGKHWRETYDRYTNEGEKYIELALRVSCDNNRLLSSEFAKISNGVDVLEQELRSAGGRVVSSDPSGDPMMLVPAAFAAINPSVVPLSAPESSVPEVSAFERGFIDGLDERGNVVGWVRASVADMRLKVALVAGGATVAVDVAERFRGDLLDAQLGDGKYGFNLAIPPEFFDGLRHKFEVRVKMDVGDVVLGDFDIVLAQRASHGQSTPSKIER